MFAGGTRSFNGIWFYNIVHWTLGEALQGLTSHVACKSMVSGGTIGYTCSLKTAHWIMSCVICVIKDNKVDKVIYKHMITYEHNQSQVIACVCWCHSTSRTPTKRISKGAALRKKVANCGVNCGTWTSNGDHRLLFFSVELDPYIAMPCEQTSYLVG